MAQAQYTVLKAVLIGPPSVGKTSLTRREADNTFITHFQANIGIEFRMKMYDVGGVVVKGQIWDPPHYYGQKFCNGSQSFLKNAHSIGFCFALNDKVSFEEMQKKVENVKNCPTSAKMFLVGCKGDEMQEIPDEEVMAYAEKEELKYFRTSSKENWGVNELFQDMMKEGLPVQQSKVIVLPTKPPTKEVCEVM